MFTGHFNNPLADKSDDGLGANERLWTLPSAAASREQMSFCLK